MISRPTFVTNVAYQVHIICLLPEEKVRESLSDIRRWRGWCCVFTTSQQTYQVVNHSSSCTAGYHRNTRTFSIFVVSKLGFHLRQPGVRLPLMFLRESWYFKPKHDFFPNCNQVDFVRKPKQIQLISRYFTQGNTILCSSNKIYRHYCSTERNSSLSFKERSDKRMNKQARTWFPSDVCHFSVIEILTHFALYFKRPICC